MPAELIANYINTKKDELGLTNKGISDATLNLVPESTVKNLCTKKTDNPGIITLMRIMDAVGGSFDEMLHPEKNKDEVKETSILAIKDLYLAQREETQANNEAHIANIRAHYEQHISEKNASFEKIETHYEKRLADKREVIAELEKHLATVNAHLLTVENEKKWFRRGFVISIIVFAALCIAELANPNLGWFRF